MKPRVLGLALFLLAAAANAQNILWRDPGNVGRWDFGGTVGSEVNPPKPPYSFLREDPSGTQPKIFVRDAAGVTWNVKFGYEAKGESFCWRVVRACGYFAEPNYFVAAGQVRGIQPLKRAGSWVQADGHFTNARFQYRYPNLKYLDGKNWRWEGPPFGGTKELSGLKILIMLFSNWDNKDGRVGPGGPNTAVFEDRNGSRVQYLYTFTDWGSGLGRWGDTTGQTNWRCDQYTQQTPGFVSGVQNGNVVFGYKGAIHQGFDTNIPPAHVAWFVPYLTHITDDQLYAGLKASGATDSEAACFTMAIRDRVDQLRSVGTH